MCFNSLNYKRKEKQQERKDLERCYYYWHFMDFLFKFSRCFSNIVEKVMRGSSMYLSDRQTATKIETIFRGKKCQSK